MSADLTGEAKQRRSRRGCSWLIALLVLAVIAAAIWCQSANRELSEAAPIPVALGTSAQIASDFVPQAIPGGTEANPFLAVAANSTMHGDGGQSDTHPAAGPFGNKLTLRSRRSGNGTPIIVSTML